MAQAAVERPVEPQRSGAHIVYPESDGKPIADNTKQFRWIVTIEGGLEALYREDPSVFVAGDLLWYPVEGHPEIRTAPDALVVYGRPKGDRGSYLQFREEHIPPHVVFEVLSPGNTRAELLRKFRFYERYGVEEYYVYDPDRGTLRGWHREGDALVEVPEMRGWVSPRMGVRFDLEDTELVLYRPDGERFASYLEVIAQREQIRRQADEAQWHATQAEARATQADERAEQERERAEQERERAEQERERAEQERERAEQERERAERLAAQLRALGITPATG